MGKIKLICLPYVGGGSRVYNRWKETLDQQIEIVCPELAGRGHRFKDPYYRNLEEAVEDIYICVEDIVNSEPYALFGHGMGSLLAFELYYKLKKEGCDEPKAIFFSGRVAPCTSMKETVHLYNKEQMIKKILSLGEAPREILNNNKLLSLYFPIIKADYKITGEYVYKSKKSLINSPCYILYGSEDDVSLDELLEWENHTLNTPRFFEFYGRHFFIKDQESKVVSLINKTVLSQMITNV